MTYPNGEIPASALHAVPNFAPLSGQQASVGNLSNLMVAVAAIQLSGLMRAFFLARGKVLSLSEGYRSVGVQNWYWDRFYYKKPGWTLAAFPRTSRHGFGISADLNVNGGNPSGDDLAWLRAHAAEFGFANDVSTEPWHWSYILTPSIIVKNYISNPQAEDSDESLPDDIRKALMAAADTLTYYQRVQNKKAQDIYFIAGPGVFADILVKPGEKTDLLKKTGLSSSQVRGLLNRDGVKAVKLDAAEYDQRRILYKTLAE